METPTIKPGEKIIETTLESKSQSSWKTVLIVVGWFLRITGALTFILAAIVFLVWGIFSPTLRDISSAVVSMAIGYGNFYYGKKIIDLDKSALNGALLVQIAAIITQLGFVAWDGAMTVAVEGNIVKCVIVMGLLWLGFQKIASENS